MLLGSFSGGLTAYEMAAARRWRGRGAARVARYAAPVEGRRQSRRSLEDPAAAPQQQGPKPSRVGSAAGSLGAERLRARFGGEKVGRRRSARAPSRSRSEPRWRRIRFLIDVPTWLFRPAPTTPTIQAAAATPTRIGAGGARQRVDAVCPGADRGRGPWRPRHDGARAQRPCVGDHVARGLGRSLRPAPSSRRPRARGCRGGRRRGTRLGVHQRRRGCPLR